MDLLKDFGFEPTFFFAQIINFLILAVIFKRYLYKPVLKVLSDRKKAVEQGIKDAEAAALALEKANEKKDEIIKDATLQSEKIFEETKSAALELRETLTTQAKTDAEKIIAEAKAAAELEFKNARESAEEIALELSRKLVDKILGEIFTKEEKAKIMSRNVKKFENISS